MRATYPRIEGNTRENQKIAHNVNPRLSSETLLYEIRT